MDDTADEVAAAAEASAATVEATAALVRAAALDAAAEVAIKKLAAARNNLTVDISTGALSPHEPLIIDEPAADDKVQQQDAKTPLRIFLVAGALNAALDVFCVGRGAFGYGLNLGVAGAAYATLVAQYAGACLFFLVLSNRRMLPREWRRWRPPSKAELRQITGISGMLLLGSLCRMGVYTMMTTTALWLGTLVMAAHQVALQIFWTLTYLVDPLFVAATSFVARDFGRRPRRVRRMSALLMGLSLVVGAAIAALSFFVANFGAGAFTDDATVLASIRSVAPLMGAAQLVSALVLVTEGVLIGCGDLRYLLDVHCLNFVVLGGVLWWVGKTGAGLQGIWVAVFMNQALRMAQHAAHVWRGGGPDLFARNGDGEEDGER